LWYSADVFAVLGLCFGDGGVGGSAGGGGWTYMSFLG
jgi:hypothetical protein